MDANGHVITVVTSAAENLSSADDEASMPIHQIESLCMRYGENLKHGGPISEKGKKITILVRNVKDLSRDIIKSDPASLYTGA